MDAFFIIPCVLFSRLNLRQIGFYGYLSYKAKNKGYGKAAKPYVEVEYIGLEKRLGISLRTFERWIKELEEVGVVKRKKRTISGLTIILNGDELKGDRGRKFVKINSEWLKRRVLNYRELGFYAFLMSKTYPIGEIYGVARLKDITQEELAAELNISLKTVKRLMKSLKRKGVLYRKRNGWGRAADLILNREVRKNFYQGANDKNDPSGRRVLQGESDKFDPNRATKVTQMTDLQTGGGVVS